LFNDGIRRCLTVASADREGFNNNLNGRSAQEVEPLRLFHPTRCFGLGRDPVTGLTARKRAFQALEAMGIGALAVRSPHQLSGGECQRLTLARGFAPAHPVLLLEEPFSNPARWVASRPSTPSSAASIFLMDCHWCLHHEC
jgi:hypothetical protein